MADNSSPHPGQKRYPPELRERAVGMVLETIEQTGERFGVVNRIARQLGSDLRRCAPGWARPRSTAACGQGHHPGQARIAALEREVRELRRTNEILRTASAFFAAELDGRRPR
jgi:transposase